MKKGKIRENLSCFLYVVAFFSFLAGITAESRGSFLDFSNLARVIFCGIAVVCVIAAAIIWKAKDVRGKKIKIGIMIGALVVIVAGGIIDSMTDNTASLLVGEGNTTATEEAIVHDLSSDGELLVSETIKKDEAFIISPAVYTNSEEISVTNNGTEDLTVYLYNFGVEIRQMSLASGDAIVFDGLNGTFPYKVGVSAEVSTQIDLTITD